MIFIHIKSLFINELRGILLILLLISSAELYARTYYISTSGNDDNNGLSPFSPWLTINKINSEISSFNHIDTILFKKGEVFYGTLKIMRRKDAKNPILISAYGIGERPMISGFITVTGWSYKGRNNWVSKHSVSTLATCNVVIINGKHKAMGRWPDDKGIPSNRYLSDVSWIYKPFSFPYRNSLSDRKSLDAGRINWSGGELVLRPMKWKFQRNIITDHHDSTITFSFPAGIENPFTSNPGNAGYFIQNHPATLNVQDEWYYDNSDKIIRIYSRSKPKDVKIAAIQTLCTISGSNITIDNIAFEGANQYGISIGNGSNITIQNCSISYTFNAIYSGSGFRLTKLAILNNYISNTNNNGIHLNDIQGYLGYKNFGYYGSKITGNKIVSTGLFAGNGGSEDYDYSGIILDYPINILIRNNHLDSLGHSGIMAFGGDSIIIDRNFINNFCFLLDDAGGIYVNTDANYRIISNNIVGNGYGSIQGLNSEPYIKRSGYLQPFGIYLDDGGGGGNNVKVINNTVFNIAHSGLVFARSNNTEWSGNTVYGCRIGIMNRGRYFDNPDYRTKIKNNIIVSTKSEIDHLNLEDGVISFGVWAKGFSKSIEMDSNFYSMPRFRNNLIYWPADKDRHISLSEWQEISGLDKHSRCFPPDMNPTTSDSLFFYYNADTTKKYIYLTHPMIDPGGKKYKDQIILPPYASVILAKDDE